MDGNITVICHGLLMWLTTPSQRKARERKETERERTDGGERAGEGAEAGARADTGRVLGKVDYSDSETLDDKHGASPEMAMERMRMAC